MTDRLSDVQARIDTVRQLDTVITAMRGMAAARSREARERLAGVRACAAMIGDAIGTALVLADTADQPAPPALEAEVGQILIVLCSEQGFAGTFNERILDRVAPYLAAGPLEILLAGDRGAMVALERGLTLNWSAPMVAHVDEAALLADRLTQVLYQSLARRHAARVTVVHALPGATAALEVLEQQLLPFDFARFKPVARSAQPLVTLAPQLLLGLLAEEYVNAQLCEAVILSFAAENEARMYAMIAARTNVRNKLGELVDRSRRLRQEEITAEIIELCAGRDAD